MPICKREGFENFSENNNSKKRNTFHDNEKVFYCETTKQIFRDYEEYFRHVMVINSTIWQCEVTKRENLTYAEALKSERRALKKREQFKDFLRPIVLLVVEKAQQASMKTLCRLIFPFLKARYFLNEEVKACNKKNGSTYNKYVVTAITPVTQSPPEGSIYDPNKITYTLRKLDGLNSGTEYKIPYDQIRRSKTSFTQTTLRMFTEDNVIRVEGILRPKPESYKKYVTDRKVSFTKLFIGKMPFFEPSRPKTGDKKQSSMSMYLTKNDGEAVPSKTADVLAAEEAARQERQQNLIKEMERVRKEKEEKQAELDRKKAERVAKIEEEAVAVFKKTDDLDRYDQKPLPRYQTIITNIPSKYFGDALVVNEFMNSFSGVLSGNNVFKNKISFFELTRAFTAREIVGPLSDIVLILMGTIFGLQQEEESECAVDYVRIPKHLEQQPFKTQDQAAETHEFVNRHYSFKLNQLPLDAHTVSEVLRLHLLASGAKVNEKAERYRLMYRNGYYSTEDPGLVFRMQQPHVLRALKMYSIYQLPMMEIFKILNTLISQILSYSSTINLIEERMEATAKAKLDLKAVVAAERQRAAAVEAERKKLVAEYATQALAHPAEANHLEDKLNKRVAEMLALSAREQKKLKEQLMRLHGALFDYMVFLGKDRAYRKYYVLESIPGVFVEHPLESLDVCMENPPKNVPYLVGAPNKNMKEMRSFLTKIYIEEEKKNEQKSFQATTNNVVTAAVKSHDNKENKENQAVVNGEIKMNGDATKMEVDGEVESEEVAVPPPPEPPTQYELLMCTGDPKNCFVHDPKNPDRQRWAYFYKEEDIDAVINGLNSLGERESQLKENLMTMRELIVEHTKKCPVDLLSMEKDRSSQFSRFKLQIKTETKKKYNAANFGFPDNHDLNEVMFAMLVDRVLQLEIDITTGDLGKLKVKDLEKWRFDIQNNTYDPQVELSWGGEQAKRPFKDPGHSLGDTLEIDSEDSADEGISLHDSTLLRQCVKNLASALLQIEQGIEQKFMKEPFGLKKDNHDKSMEPLLEKGRERLKEWEISLMHSTSYSQVFLHLNILHGAIKWQRSTNKSLCAICKRGTDPEKMLLCDECNAGTHMFCMKPKMKTVPEGNWYCNKCVNNGFSNEKPEPKKKKQKRAFMIDEEDNASVNSSQSNGRRQSRRRRTIEEEEVVEENLSDDDEAMDGDDSEDQAEESEEEKNSDEEDREDDEEEHQQLNGKAGKPLSEEEEEQEEEGDSESDDEEICAVCSYNGGEISCAGCKSIYHLDCADLRRTPRGNWNCKTCRNDQSKKRKSKQNAFSDDSTEDEDYDEPLAKRARSSTTSSSSKRSSVRNSMHDNSLNSTGNNDSFRQYNNNNNNNRRRRAENLPLNSSLLYDLLDEIMKNENAWPFLRPVMHSEVPDYHTIIKEPMDFAKVKSKLNMGKYTINEELLKDIELVFKNCDIYNQEGNEIYEAGCSLEKFVMQRCKEHNLPFQPSDMNRS